MSRMLYKQQIYTIICELIFCIRIIKLKIRVIKFVVTLNEYLNL